MECRFRYAYFSTLLSQYATLRSATFREASPNSNKIDFAYFSSPQRLVFQGVVKKSYTVATLRHPRPAAFDFLHF
jgi:hypothetical protein